MADGAEKLARTPSRRAIVMMAALAVVTALAQVWLFRELQHDDAYITFRYARNIAIGRGFVFNPGERILGTTTPLFTLLMVVPHWLGVDVRFAALLTSAIALRVAAAALFVLLRRHSWTVALAVFSFGCLGGFGSLSFALLETFTVAALVLTSLASFADRRPLAAGVLAGCAFMCRYDAALLLPMLAAAGWLRDRKLPLRALAAAVATASPWLVFASAYFGSLLPRTLRAKALLTPFGEYLHHYAVQAYSIVGLTIPWPVGLALSLAGLALFVRTRNVCAVLLVLQGALHLLVYAGIGPPKEQHWHNFLPILALRTAAVAGLIGWLDLAKRSKTVQLVAATAGIGVGLALAVGSYRASTAIADSFWLGRRHRQYVEVADWVEARLPRQGRFMATEVGTLGYLTDRVMIDPFGLVSVTNSFPRSHKFLDYVELVEHYRPEVLLMDDTEHADVLAAATEYEVVHVFPWRRPWSTLLVRRELDQHDR